MMRTPPMPSAATMVHAIEIVTAAHRARLSEPTLATAEKIARDCGATREQLQRAVARGLQALVLCALAVGCRPAKAAVTPPSDTARPTLSLEVAHLPVGATIPGARKVGLVGDCELWEVALGEYVAVTHRPKPVPPARDEASCLMTAVVVGLGGVR